ncbi:MAG TPA: Tat pathway signal sequence domain protein [Alphaproteobacteria bacterium]|nr:Tat pathway signal sequence domain protein [Alphaproteobacteria bacterium]
MSPVRSAVLRIVSALVCCAAFAATPAAADTSATTLGVELNKLEQTEAACRAYLVFDNRTGTAFDELKLDLVFFGTGGVISKRMAVGVAPLAADKTSVKLFDIADLDCAAVGRVLINDVLACADASGERDDCVGLLRPTSLADAQFVK